MGMPEQQEYDTDTLTCGERRRLQLCLVLMQNPNFLFLDEPTNDMDIVTLQVLEEYLQDFKGCVIVVSHDRYFMDKVVDHVLVFKGSGVVDDFPGNYTQYRSAGKQKQQDNTQTSSADKGTAQNTGGSVKPRLGEQKNKMTFKEKREFQQLEQDIEILTEEKRQIESALSSGRISVEEITTMSKRLPVLNEELDAKEMRWLELSEKA